MKETNFFFTSLAFKGLENVYESGFAKAIGVSNFNIQQLERILKVAKVPIHNLQVGNTLKSLNLHLKFYSYQ